MTLASSPDESVNALTSTSPPTITTSTSTASTLTNSSPYPVSPRTKNAMPSSIFTSLDQTIGSSTATNSTCSPITRPSTPLLPPLEDLVNDCFLHSMGQLEDEGKIKVVQDFTDYLTKQHTQENLNFLVDIYRYEYYYKLKFDLNNNEQEASTNNYISNGTLNCNNNESELNLRYHSCCSLESLSNMRKTRLIQSVDLDPQNAFVSTIDDLDDFGNANENIWDNLKDKYTCSDDENDNKSQDQSVNNPNDEQDPDIILLNDEWKYIMNTYIKCGSPMEINISQTLFKQIVQESAFSRLHHPQTLTKASKEVLRMLNENGYVNFNSHMKKLLRKQLKSPTSSTPILSPSTSPLPYIGDSMSPSSLTSKTKPYNIPNNIQTHRASKSIASSPGRPSTINHSNTESGSFFSKFSSLPKKTNKILNSANGNNSSGTDNSSTTSSSSSTASISVLLGHLKLGKDNNGNPTAASTSNLNGNHDKHISSRSHKISHQHLVHRSHHHHTNHHIKRTGTFHGVSVNDPESSNSSDVGSDYRSLNASPVSINNESGGTSSLKFWSRKK